MKQQSFPFDNPESNTVLMLQQENERLHMKLKLTETYNEELHRQIAHLLNHTGCSCPNCTVLRQAFRTFGK